MSSNNKSTTGLPPVTKASSSSSSVPEDRRARQEWIQQQLEDRKKRCQKEDQEKQLEIQQLHERLWSPFVREFERTHELNIAWKQDKGFFSWDRVLQLTELEALRITGFALQSIPGELPSALRSLTTLSLIACQLETLPDSIGDFRSLTELDLTKNNLTRLPDSITTLTDLRHLNLSSNLLVELPADFGNLIQLDKLWVENNRLTTLPDSIARSQAHTANFNNNLLTELPDAIGSMPNLVNLSVNMNQLVEFPDALTRLTTLQTLHASRNKLIALPRNIGNLPALRDLRLDWNQITELPFSFRLLPSLQTLCMERNLLKLPPLEYISKGVSATMLYIERSLEEFIRKSRRQVVEKLLDVLTFSMRIVDGLRAIKVKKDPVSPLSDEDKADLDLLDAHFEPRVERVVKQNEKLPFFGIVWDAFFEELLPVIERRAPKPFGLLETCTRDEIDDALQHYDDFFGPASLNDNATEFRKCTCIDEIEWKYNGVKKRKVCVPGTIPYRCQRKALLVRMTMMTKEEAKDQMASTYLKRKIERLSIKTKRKCVEYINSEEGVGHFEKLALDLAKKHCKRRKRVKKLRLHFTKTKANLEKKKAKLQAKLDAFVKVKMARRKALEEKLEALRKERSAIDEVKNAKKAKRLNEKIADSEQESTQEPVEDKKILKVELAMEGIKNAEVNAQEDFEKAKEIEMNDGQPVSADEDDGVVDDDDEEEKEKETEDGDDSEPEDDDDDDDDDDEEEESEENDETEASTVAATETVEAGEEARSFFDIEMPDLHVEDYRRVTTRAIENNLGEERVVNEEELLILYQQQLRDAYVAEKCALVEKKATYEFLQMRAVLKRWMGLGTRSIFEGWRDVVKANRANAEQIKAKQARKKLIEQQNKVLAEELARVEARKWVERVDLYTDAVYYEHCETFVTSWTPPTYWEEEQQKLKHTSSTSQPVPMLKLPPI